LVTRKSKHMIKNKTLSLLFYLRKDALNEKGEAPIYLRITVNGQRSAVTLNRHIDPLKWNSAGKAKGNKEEIKELNGYLDSVKNSIHAHQRNMLDRNKVITADSLRNAFLGLNEQKHTILELFEEHNKEMKEKIGKDFALGTHTRYVTTYEHVKAFIKHKYHRSDLQLTELDFKFITDFEHYLKTKPEGSCNHNSTLKYIRNFRKIVNIAVANDWLDKDPFIKYKSKLEETTRTFLSADELKAIEETEISIPRVDVVRDIFVFACYTGLAYVDVEKLTPNDLRNGIDGKKWIFTQRTKTESKSNIPLLPKALAVIEKYKNSPECAHSGKLLPIKSNQRMNSYLKDVAATCKVDKELTFHMARHTFATTVTLTNGVPIESVSNMLGHKNIRTTQIYAKVVERKVSEDMADLEKRMNKKPAKRKIVKAK
jgi:site-specific recombinase XerD